MSFLKLSWALPIFAILLVFAFFMVKSLQSRESFLADTFFKKPKKIVYLKKVFFILGLFFLGLSLLDPRGPQEKIESSVPDQKTIIIIDSSASMLAEDVRPNRFKKSILMARHFIKKAFGHKIAVVLFSDIQKKLVPFTDDLDLLDARVAGLEDLRIYDGGSNISQAIKESLGYFRADNGSVDDVGGNVLVFTDSEGHDEEFDLVLPEKISLAIVGVGTAKGARIPNRDRYGVFRGYKKFQSKEVITRLNEDWLKSLSSKVKTYNYWIANSYTIPTEEILGYFNKYFSKKINKGNAVVRPVKVDAFLIPSIIFFTISFLLYYPQGFALPVLIVTFLLSPDTFAVDVNKDMAEKLRQKMKEGKLNTQGKLKFAEILLRAKEGEAAQTLYEEHKDKLSYKDKNNYAVTLLMNKKPIDALKQFSEIQKDDKNGVISMNDQERSELRQNILLALQAKKQQDQQKKKESEEKNKEQKDDEGKGGGQSGDKSDEDKGKKGGDQNKEKKDDKGKEKNKNKQKKDEKGDKKGKPESLKEKQDRIRKQRKMVKIPGLIKQIMSDDRTLQKKYLDTSTNEPKAYQKKDW